jgi:DEAD/DEAH box helicase domain-containing protein
MQKVLEVIFDVETKKFFDEVNEKDPSILGVSLVSLYKRTLDENLNEIEGRMHSFFEEDFSKMWELFEGVNRIIGFNSIKFDVPALKPYAPSHFHKLPHFDILDEIRKANDRRVSLDRLAKDTLGKGKNDSGENAIKYFRKGDPESLRLLKKYCEMDVELTRDLYDYALKNKQLKFTDHWNTPRVIEIDFSYPEGDESSSSQIGLF